VRFDDFLAREANVAQQTDTVLDDTAINEQLIAESCADDHQHGLDQAVTLA